MYRTVDTATWTDDWVQTLPAHARYLFVYLLTNHRATACGAFELTPGAAARETGLSRAEVESALAALAPKVQYWPEYDIVWVQNFYRRQRANSNEKFTISARNALLLLPPCIQQAVWVTYPELRPGDQPTPDPSRHGTPHTVSNPTKNGIANGIDSGIRQPTVNPIPDPIPNNDNSNRDQITVTGEIPPTPQPNEAPAAPETGAVDNFSPWFDEFWALYPTRRGKKLNKAHARDRAKNLSSRDWDSVLQAVRNYANSDQGRRGVVEDAHRFLAHWQDWQDPEVEPVMQKGSTRDKPLYPTADERRSESYAAWGRIARGPDPASADDPRQLGPDLRLVRQSIA